MLRFLLACQLVLVHLAAEPAGDGLARQARRYLAALRYDPLLDDPFFQLVALYRSAGKEDIMLEQARALLKEVKWGAAAQAIIARVERAEGKPNAAKATLERAIKLYPRSSELWELKSRIEEESGDFPTALKSAQRALNLAKRRVQRWRITAACARLLAGMDRGDELARLVALALRRRDPPPRAFLALVEDLRSRGSLQPAIKILELYSASLRKDSPESLKTAGLKADILAQAGQVEEAWVMVRGCILETLPGSPQWMHWERRLLALAARPSVSKKVITFLQKRASAAPNPFWDSLLARTYLRRGRDAEAQATLKKWESLDERSPWFKGNEPTSRKADAAIRLAAVFADTGNHGIAARSYGFALKLAPSRIDVRWRAIQAWKSTGNKDKLREECRELLKRAPESSFARAARQVLFESWLEEGKKHYHSGAWKASAAAFRYAEEAARGKSHKARALVWEILALSKHDADAARKKWPATNEIPRDLLLQVFPGLLVSAPWLISSRASLVTTGEKTGPRQNKPIENQQAYKRSWTFVPPNPFNKIRHIDATNKALVCQLESGALLCLDAVTGLPTWRRPAPRAVTRLRLVRTTLRWVVACEGSKLVLLDTMDGRVMQEYQLNAVPLSIARYGDSVVCLLKDGSIVGLPGDRSDTLWRTRVLRLADDSLTIAKWYRAAGKAILITRNVHVIEPGSGLLLWMYEPPENLPWGEQVAGIKVGDFDVMVQRRSGARLVINILRPHEARLLPSSAARTGILHKEEPVLIERVESKRVLQQAKVQNRVFLLDEEGNVHGFSRAFR